MLERPTIQTPPASSQSENMDIEAIRDRVSSILLPSVLPPGYELRHSLLAHNRDVFLTFCDAQGLAGEDTFPPPYLTLRLVRRAHLEVKEGFSEEIAVGAQMGMFIRGLWTRKSATSPRVWREDLCTSIVVERDGWVAIVSGNEKGVGLPRWEPAMLVSIAVSLQLQ